MDKDSIIYVLEKIGADNIRSGRKNVQCSCFLAPWRNGHRHKKDDNPSMGISIEPEGESKIHCFTCKFGGTFVGSIDLLSSLSGKDYSELIDDMSETESIDVSVLIGRIEPYDKYSNRKPDISLGDDILCDMEKIHHDYLIDRGFEEDTLDEWEACFDKERKRAVFPIRRHSGDLVGAVGRTVIDSNIKYYNYFGFDKSRYLFGENKIKEGTCLVVVEGLLDTVKVWQSLQKEGLLETYSVVGLLGSDYSEHQCRKIVEFSDEVILFLDNDKAGYLGTNKLGLSLQKKVILKFVDYPDNIGRDPDEVVRNGVSLGDLFTTSKLLVVRYDNSWRKRS